MRRYSSVQKSCGWPNVYARVQNESAPARAEQIFQTADRLLEEYQSKYESVKGRAKMHVSAAYTVAALYFPLKENFGEEKAKKLLEEGAKPASLKKKSQMEKMPPKMFIGLCRVMTNQFFGEKAGFVNEDHSKDKTEVRFDILSCPYYNTLKELGCPEACPVICVQDDYSYRDMKNSVFERTKTIGGGDDRCDFCYRLKQE